MSGDLVGLDFVAAPGLPIRAAASATGEKRFFYTLDGIRGVAAILVVLWHTGIVFGLDHHHKNYMAVDIFFVLSGVVICKTYEERMKSGLTAGRFTLIRLIRIYPLYLFGTAISVGMFLGGFGPPLSHDHLAILIVLAVFFIPNPIIGKPAFMFPLNGPAWSLFFELATNIVYAFTLRFLSNRVLMAVIAILGIGLTFFIFHLPDHRVDIGFTVKSGVAGICRSGYSFFAGVLLYRLFSASRGLPARWFASHVVPWLILAVVAVILVVGVPAALNPYYDSVCVLFVFPGLIYLALHCEPGPIGGRIFQFAGGLSYAVYAVHASLFHAIEGIAAHHHYNLAATAPISGLVFLAGLLLICVLLNKFYDVPLRRTLTRRFLK